jgi:methyl-accepting chemotaxis protein
MAEVQYMAEQNAEIAKSTKDRVQKSKYLMEGSTRDFERMTAAIDSITESSHHIESVIKAIDDIAFQTNILALNAAIEAARAGAHGRGFAVVADEVRELASKSSAAARETSELIQMSIQSVSEGNVIVRQTAESIKKIGVHAASSADDMDRLAESSESQRQSVSEINRGISQISNIVQSISAIAQQNSVTARKMSTQSENLGHLVSRFKLRNDQENHV